MSNDLSDKEYFHPTMQEMHEFVLSYALKVRDGELTLQKAAREAAGSDFARFHGLSEEWISNNLAAYSRSHALEAGLAVSDGTSPPQAVWKPRYRVAYSHDDSKKAEMIVEADDEFVAEDIARKRLSEAHPEIDEADWDIDEPEGVRPPEGEAWEAIYAFLCEEMGQEDADEADFDMAPDGDNAWAFWVREEDTTSYLHSNLRVEWYGTGWRRDAGKQDESDPSTEESDHAP